MQFARYDRQLRFAPVGRAGQQRLHAARVLLVGAGALGSVVAELLTRAGVGTLRLADRDTVELSNLQRQTLYTEADADAGLAKVEAAASHLAAINREVAIEPHACDVHAGNIAELAAECDLLVDGTDNFATRFLINEVALERGLPWVHGGCVGASGQVFSFWPGTTICFRCLVPTVPDPAATDTCDTVGVIGPATHLIASLQAAAAMRLLIAGREAAEGMLWAVDVWRGSWHQIDTAPLARGDCPTCQGGAREFLRGQHAATTPISLCGRNAVQIPAPPSAVVDLEQLAARWSGLGEVSRNRFLVRLQLEGPHQITVFRDGRAVIGGTEDIRLAKSLHARYVGH